MANIGIDEKAGIKVLNHILESELAGMVRPAHFASMLYGYNRIPIIAWMPRQTTESW